MTEIRLHNTKTRKKDPFAPIDPENVRMYVCGPTVYDRAHLGNARPVVVFDVLYRLLTYVYGPEHVTYVRNFTDVDDRINETAKKRKKAGAVGTLEELIRERSDETIGWFHEDMAELGTLAPTHQPRATEYIEQMKDLIQILIEKKHAYVVRDKSNNPPQEYVLFDRELREEEHALFDVDSYPEYGQLSGRSTKDMIAGARVEIAPYKRNSMDFVLWKPSPDDLPGWDSPWGRGRPGWHIECSAMAHALLGESFDIHGGGNDLMFPHHENEIAQSRCAHPGSDFARYWLHNEMLQVEGKKMSKSLGNFFTVRDLLDQGVPGEVIRFVFLSTHYRKPMDWTAEKAREAQRTLERWHRLTSELMPGSQVNKKVIDALADDLNTHLALSALNALRGSPQELLDTARFLGFLDDVERAAWRKRQSVFSGYFCKFGFEPAESEQKVVSKFADIYLSEYQKARESKDYSSVDKLRDAAQSSGMKVSVSVEEVQIDWPSRPSADEIRQLVNVLEGDD